MCAYLGAAANSTHTGFPDSALMNDTNAGFMLLLLLYSPATNA